MAFSERFPLLGFPNESNLPAGDVVYQAHWWNVRIALWSRDKGWRDKSPYAVNLYHNTHTDNMPTHVQDRYCLSQQPIVVEDAFEAQLAINYLIQKHLPQELIDDINRGLEAVRQSYNEACDVRVDAAAREAME